MTLKQVKFFNLFVMTFAVCFLIFIVLPRGRDIYELQKTIELTRIKISNGQRAIDHQSTLEKQVAIQHAVLDRILKMFVNENEQPLVYQVINETAKTAGVTMLSLKPQPQDMSEDMDLGAGVSYRRLPLRIEVEGGYRDLARFFSAITAAPKYFSIQELACQGPENRQGPIKATLIIHEYIRVSP
jgi:Tfp pilus assembly protein PilO